MTSYLLLMICVLAFFQEGEDRFSALTYAIMCAGHTVALGWLEGCAYFISAAMADLVIIAILCFWARVSRLSDILISISMFSGAVNACGWLSWEHGISIEIYYHACITLYTLAIAALIRKDGAIGYGGNLCNFFFRWLGRPGYALRCMLRETAK